jgi:hypothetical protein
LPSRLKERPWSILDLAQAMAQEFDCPPCEISTPMGEALAELMAAHFIQFNRVEKQVILA